MRALVTGAGGQQGSYLCELLLSRGYNVTGVVRPSGDGRSVRFLADCLNRKAFNLVYADLTVPEACYDIAHGGYDEVYHLAAATNVGQSFECPAHFFEINTKTTCRLLEGIRRYSPLTRFYFAATSEMFGANPEKKPQGENWPLHAVSPYGASKIASFQVCQQYRDAYGLHVVIGIPFNNESPRRGDTFVTQKLVKGVRRFKRLGIPVTIARLDSWRDWHHTEDTVRGIFLAMQEPNPDTFVFASGKTHSVEEFARLVCSWYDVPFEEAVKTDNSQVRPLDLTFLLGDPRKAELVLGWKRAYDLPALVDNMCLHAENRI